MNDFITRSNQVETAARDIAGILNRNGVWLAADAPQVIRDIASFTITAPSGEQFTVAVSPVR